MSEKKRGRGRPKSDNPKEETIAIRCEPELYARAQVLAERDDASLAKIGRKALEQYLDRRGV